MFFPSSSRLALVTTCLLSTCSLSSASTSGIFEWAFRDNSVSSTLGTCQTFGITVQTVPGYNGTSSAVPPYYMRAFEKGGGVQTAVLGSDTSNLSWTVTSPTGSQLLLNVIDSNDSSAGVAPTIFTIATGSNTNCVIQDQQSTFTVTSNVSSPSVLQPCQQWGLRIHGGVPPYNISFAQPDSPVVTNVTTVQQDDAYTYINRADGGELLLASVVDSTGKIAYGNPSIMTASKTDIDCGSLVSSSGNATALDQADADAAKAAQDSKDKRRAGIIAGVVVGVLAILLVAGGAFWWWRKRRPTSRSSSDIDPDLQPSPYMSDSSGQLIAINTFTDQAPQSLYSQKSHGRNTLSMSDNTQTSMQFDPYHLVDTHSEIRPTSTSSNPTSTASLLQTPLTPLRRSKAAEAGFSAATESDTTSQRPRTSGSGSNVPVRSTSLLAPGVNMSGEREIVYQHRDGGVVRELPPPYLDRSRQENPES